LDAGFGSTVSCFSVSFSIAVGLFVAVFACSCVIIGGNWTLLRFQIKSSRRPWLWLGNGGEAPSKSTSSIQIPSVSVLLVVVSSALLCEHYHVVWILNIVLEE
jgi:hypothetical protein